MANPSQDQKWQQWMVLVQEGDKKAYNLLLAEIYPAIKSFVMSKVGPNAGAEDITQECLIAIHRALNTYDPARPFKPWMYTIVRYKLIDILRKKQKQWKREVVNDEIVATFPAPASNSHNEGDKEVVQKALKSLPEEMRRAIVYTKLEGLSTKEAAEKENISTVALRSRVSRAYKILRKKLESEVNG